MAGRITQPPHGIELDEWWIAEWIAFGFRELRVYLAHHAAFDQWLTTHDRKDTP